MRAPALLTLCCCVVLVCGCRDVTLPAAQHGRVSGVAVVTEVSGRVVPVAGASARVLGTGLATRSNDAGAFQLEPIGASVGQLVVGFDQDGDGVDDHQRSFDFQTWGIAPGRETALGQVVLRDSATVQGRVLLASDGGAQALAGSEVFVLGLPARAVTNDTGAFVLGGVPEGNVALAVARDGYQARRVEVTVSSGALLELAPVTLAPAAAGVGTVQGVLVPSALSGATVTLLTAAGEVDAPLTEGAFSRATATGRVTVLARAPGYSDSAVVNVLVSTGEVTDVGTLTLEAGSAQFQPPTGDAGLVLAGCGDGVVATGEACDDGNRVAGDGCSPACALELQAVGGESCAAPTPLRLVPIGGGQLGAQAGGSGVFSADLVNACHTFPEATHRFTLPVRARVLGDAQSAAASLGVFVRPALACERVELQCVAPLATDPLPPGDYVAIVSSTNASFTYSLTLTVVPTPTTSTCGDAVVAPDEGCDDGNKAWGDGCGADCELEAQPGDPVCTHAPVVQLSRLGPNASGALLSFSTVTGVDPAVFSCLDPRAAWQDLHRVVLTKPADLSLSVLPGGALQAVSVFQFTDCATLSLLGCAMTPSANDGASLQLSGLDAGTYLVGIGAGALIQRTAQVIVRPR
jgi:cysteine-rich repeat protein